MKRLIAISIVLIFPIFSFAQDTTAEVISKQQDSYVNEEFAIKLKKIPGWEFRVAEDKLYGTKVLNISFLKASGIVNLKNILIIMVSKYPAEIDLKFPEGADEAMVRSAKDKNAVYIKDPYTIIINGIKSREMIYEYIDQKLGGNKIISTLVSVPPLRTKSGFIGMDILFRCVSSDYPGYAAIVENMTQSIEIKK